jgi:hypothetical protein
LEAEDANVEDVEVAGCVCGGADGAGADADCPPVDPDAAVAVPVSASVVAASLSAVPAAVAAVAALGSVAPVVGSVASLVGAAVPDVASVAPVDVLVAGDEEVPVCAAVVVAAGCPPPSNGSTFVSSCINCTISLWRLPEFWIESLLAAGAVLGVDVAGGAAAGALPPTSTFSEIRLPRLLKLIAASRSCVPSGASVPITHPGLFLKGLRSNSLVRKFQRGARPRH